MIERHLLQRLLDWGTAPAGDPATGNDVLARLLRDTHEALAAPAAEGDLIAQEVVYAPPPGLGAALCLIHDNLLKLAGNTGAIVRAIAPELVDDGQAELPLDLPPGADDGVVGE
jgi:hypothetical protein